MSHYYYSQDWNINGRHFHVDLNFRYLEYLILNFCPPGGSLLIVGIDYFLITDPLFFRGVATPWDNNSKEPAY